MNHYETLLIEEKKPVLKITFNRPDKANAMNSKMNEELNDILTKLRDMTDYKYVIFTGSGRFFSAGADMHEVMTNMEHNTRTPTSIRTDQLNRQEFVRKLENLDQITIAAINGPMYGAGFAVGMVCDFRIMADNATACLPEAERGFFFSAGGTPSLVHLIGPAKTKELIMLNKVIDAEEALRIGLVTEVSPENELSNAVDELINTLNKSPFTPLRLTKKIVNAATPILGNTLIYEPELQAHLFNDESLIESIGSFKK